MEVQLLIITLLVLLRLFGLSFQLSLLSLHLLIIVLITNEPFSLAILCAEILITVPCLKVNKILQLTRLTWRRTRLNFLCVLLFLILMISLIFLLIIICTMFRCFFVILQKRYANFRLWANWHWFVLYRIE